MSEYRIRRKRAPLRAELMDSQVASRDLNVAFAKRLQKAMDAKGWSQADLARQASVFLEPKGDKPVEITRDNISKYMNGKMIPRGDRLAAMARARGVASADLITTEGITSVAERTPPIGATDTGKGTAWLRVNQEVPWATALKILELLKGEKGE